MTKNLINDKYSRNNNKLRTKGDILILCCGNTEKIYFELFKEKYKNYLKKVKIKIVSHKKSQPLEVVNEAIKQKIKDPNVEVWAVFDYDNESCFDMAIEEAIKNDIYLAFSNICFEYWFFLHFKNNKKSMTSKMLITELENKYNITYDKKPEAINTIFKKIINNITVAEERALNFYETYQTGPQEKISKWCSCTSVFKLTKKLREWRLANRGYD